MNTGNGDSSGSPFRTSAPAGVFAYGCPPIQPEPSPIGPPLQPMLPVVPSMPFDWSKMHPEVLALTTCARCNRHHRVAEPCPFCMRADIDALKIAVEMMFGKDALNALLVTAQAGATITKPAEEIERLRTFIRKLLGAMRDIHQVTGSQRLADLITEGDLLLGPAPKTTP